MQLQKTKPNTLKGITPFASLFDNFFSPDYFGGSLPDSSFRSKNPAVNISENEGAYYLDFAAPGLKKENFKIEMEDGTLSISSETKSESTTSSLNMKRQEFSYHNFKRSFILPENIDESEIKANYEDGVLKIEIPKSEIEKPKKKTIEIG